MAVQIEPVDDEYSQRSPIRLRVGEDGMTTCIEIKYADLPKVIKALFAWYAWTDDKAAAALLRREIAPKRPRRR